MRGLDPEVLGRSTTRCARARRLPGRCRSRDGVVPALPNERYRIHRAVRALLEGLTATKPVVLVLDDVHWADSGSAELLGALLRRLPAAPVRLARGCGRASCRSACRSALERAQRAGALTRIELGALNAEEARASWWGPRVTGRRGRPVRGERRKPVLPRAARSWPAGATGDDRGGLGKGARWARWRSRGGRGRARGGVRRAERNARGSWCRARRWRAIRSSPSWPRRPRRRTSARRWTLSTSCSPPISCARPTCHGASDSATRSCGGRCTSRRLAAGGCSRTSAPSCARGARSTGRSACAPRRALGAAGRRGRGRRACARPERRPHSVRLQRPHAGSTRALRLHLGKRSSGGAGRAAPRSRGVAHRDGADNREPRGAAREPRAGARPTRSPCVFGSSRPAPASSISSALLAGARPPGDRSGRARGPRLARGGRAHDRARHRRPVPGGLRGHGELGGACGHGGQKARGPRVDRRGALRAGVRGRAEWDGGRGAGTMRGSGAAGRQPLGRRARSPPRRARVPDDG